MADARLGIWTVISAFELDAHRICGLLIGRGFLD
jgi:hypothetical protein